MLSLILLCLATSIKAEPALRGRRLFNKSLVDPVALCPEIANGCWEWLDPRGFCIDIENLGTDETGPFRCTGCSAPQNSGPDVGIPFGECFPDSGSTYSFPHFPPDHTPPPTSTWTTVTTVTTTIVTMTSTMTTMLPVTEEADIACQDLTSCGWRASPSTSWRYSPYAKRMYVQSYSNDPCGTVYELQSPGFKFDSQVVVTFKYMIYGDSAGSMSLLGLAGDGTWTKLWEIVGATKEWEYHRASVLVWNNIIALKFTALKQASASFRCRYSHYMRLRDVQVEATELTAIPDMITGRAWQQAAWPEERACRGANSTDNSEEYYVLLDGYTPYLSYALCQEACLDRLGKGLPCYGVEYSTNRCEIWTRSGGIGAWADKPGYSCARFGWPVKNLHPLPLPGNDAACRGDSSSDNSASYYELMPKVDSLDACRAWCMYHPQCHGIEYNRGGRCEVWTRPIRNSTARPGYTCLSF